jgi:F-type H+-transporting ATPase subunit b
MEQTLQALGGILLRAIPTVILVLLLNMYFRRMLFGPLDKVLQQRAELTEGARKAAEASFKAAEEKAAAHERALAEARVSLHREQEEMRRGWIEEQAREIAEARASSHAMVESAKKDLATEVEAARSNLVESSAALADQIASSVLTRRLG